MADLTKLILHSNYPAFKNNRIYTGTLQISGSTTGGLNTRSWTVTLDKAPDLLDVVFNGPTDTIFGNDPRPSDGWFKNGAVWTPTNNAGGGNPAPWIITYSLTGTVVTINAAYVQQFTTAESISTTNFSYRFVDYSAL